MVPLVVCLRFVSDNTVSHKVLLCALLVLIGFASILALVPLMAEISYIIEDKEKRTPGIWGEKGVYGIAYGLFMTFFSVGGTAASLSSGYLMEGPGWGTTTLFLGVWIATCLLTCLLYVGGSIKESLVSLGRKEPGYASGQDTATVV